MADDTPLVEIFRTSDPGLLALVRSALEAAGIPCAVQGEGAIGLFGVSFLPSALTRGMSASIRVEQERAAEAEAVAAGCAEAELPPEE